MHFILTDQQSQLKWNKSITESYCRLCSSFHCFCTVRTELPTLCTIVNWTVSHCLLLVHWHTAASDAQWLLWIKNTQIPQYVNRFRHCVLLQIISTMLQLYCAYICIYISDHSILISIGSRGSKSSNDPTRRQTCWVLTTNFVRHPGKIFFGF